MWTPRADRLVTLDQEPAPRSEHQSLEAWIDELPPFFLSNSDLTRDVSAASKRGLLRSLGRRLYTTRLEGPAEQLVQTNALAIAALRCPGCVLSHRSALEMRHADGVLFLTGSRSTTHHLPGLVLKVRRGPAELPGDTQLLGLTVASPARAYLENLSYTRKSQGVTRSLSRARIETLLELLLRRAGDAGLLALLEQARALAPPLDAASGLELLEDLVGALLGTRPQVELKAPVAIARSEGLPYDEGREQLFTALADELLEHWSETSRPCPPLLGPERQLLAFFDAYFSNYIEGTRFEVEEARAIVYERAPSSRPRDAHDVLATYQVLMDRREMLSATLTPSLEDFEYGLERRHGTIMRQREDKRPGLYKQVANQAGRTVFVAPELVRGTLALGLEHFSRLTTAFMRAVFMMFLVAEVHPFDDGNGRLARILMNAELAAGGEHRIMIPVVYRPDYLGTLRLLSREGHPRNFVRMLDRAQEYCSRLPYGSYAQLRDVLEQTHAFADDEDLILRLPPRRD